MRIGYGKSEVLPENGEDTEPFDGDPQLRSVLEDDGQPTGHIVTDPQCTYSYEHQHEWLNAPRPSERKH